MKLLIEQWHTEISAIIQSHYPAFEIPLTDYSLTGWNYAGKAMAHKAFYNLELAEKNKDTFKEVVAHELAHCWELQEGYETGVFERGHGKSWKTKMIALGYSPETTHNFSKIGVVKTFIYKCKCCTREKGERTHNKAKKFKLKTGREFYTCKKCRGKVKYTGIYHE